ncbi:uncharacterized protein LOC123532128 [Mercenaria mercenaria]|uniref:uncharacterized protein LOC123532128 n=1 Tax=Mercenaria mercenaria TaxID=6596 RepID=UPI00234F5E04|nr:uncharacterized protein LOC123532128 [Mercenaria mercenaria]
MKLLLAAIVSLFLLHTLGIPLSSNTRYMTIDQQLECYNCGSVGWNVESCNKTSICLPNNACFLSFSSTGMSGNYNLSCKDNKVSSTGMSGDYNLTCIDNKVSSTGMSGNYNLSCIENKVSSTSMS